MTPLGHVLVVEDDQSLRESLRETLLEQNWLVSEASDGEHAIEQLRRGPRPDVVLLDLMMPRMNGWQLLVALRREPRIAHDLPVVVMSAAPLTSFEPLRDLVAGALRKPFDVAQLLHLLEAAAAR